MVGTHDAITTNKYNDPGFARFNYPAYYQDFGYDFAISRSDEIAEPKIEEILYETEIFECGADDEFQEKAPKEYFEACFIPDKTSTPEYPNGEIKIRINNLFPDLENDPENLRRVITDITALTGENPDEFLARCAKFKGESIGNMCIVDGKVEISFPVQQGDILLTGTAANNIILSWFYKVEEKISLSDFLSAIEQINSTVFRDKATKDAQINALKANAHAQELISATTTPSPTLKPEETSIPTLTPTPSPIATSNLDQLEAPISQTEIDSSSQQSTTELSHGQQTALKIGGLLLFAGLAVLAVKLITD